MIYPKVQHHHISYTQKPSCFLFLAAVAILLLASTITRAGSGSLDASNQELNLFVLLAYPPPQADIDTISTTLQRTSEMLCDATEGQLRIGKVTLRSGGCESGDCQSGIDQADIWFSPTNNPGAGQASVCADEVPCSSLGRSGANVVLSRFYLEKPAVLAHELGHYVLNLGDAYRQYQCKSSRPPYAELFECGALTATETTLMLAEACGSSVDYTELTTDATLPSAPQVQCAPSADVFTPSGICEAADACTDVGGYGADYDGFRNETATRLPLCNLFSPNTCEFEWSATQWFGFFNHKVVLSEFEQAAINLAALNGGNSVFDTIVTGVPDSGVPADRAVFCAQSVEIDIQTDLPNQVAMVLDRSYSMAFPASKEFEKCDPVAGCPEICGNKIDDNGKDGIDEADCRQPRMEALKSLSLNYVDFMASAAAEAIEVGVQSFACTSRTDVEPQVITNALASSTFNPAINNLNPGGSTAIADALRSAASQFENGGNRAILLVTDGFNTCGDPDIGGAIQELVADGIVVDAISFGPAVASSESAGIAEATGGKYLAVDTATELGPAFARQWANRVHAGKLIPQLPYHVARDIIVPQSAPTTIAGVRDGRVVDSQGSISASFGQSPDSLPETAVDRFQVLVEDGATRIFVLLASSEEDYNTVGIRAQLQGPPGPNGNFFDTDAAGSNPFFNVTRRRAYSLISLDDPNPGVWTINVIAPSNQRLDREQRGYITVLTQSSSPSFVANVTERFISDPDKGTIITGYARYQEAAMEGANVRATVRKPDGTSIAVDVEGGIDPIVEAGYFIKLAGTNIQDPGRYEVRLSLFATPATTMLRRGDSQPNEPLPVTLERTITESFWVLDGLQIACRCADNADCDNDGLVGESTSVDTDGDGKANACDQDIDNDEIDDGRENPGADDDGDGIVNEEDPDSDNDGNIDGEDPNIGSCDPPIVSIKNSSANLCEGSLRLDVSVRTGDPVVKAKIPISLPDIGVKVEDISPGIDAIQAGLRNFRVHRSRHAKNEFEVFLRFDSRNPLGPGHELRLIEIHLSTASVEEPVLADACPSFENYWGVKRPELKVLRNRKHCDAHDGWVFAPWRRTWWPRRPTKIVADSFCGNVLLTGIDTDNDRIGDACDNCPFTPNEEQDDVDIDGLGNVCDAVTSECADGMDNDGDGLSDEGDPGCSSFGDLSERDGDLVCDNGIDDDFDGSTDTEDQGCSNPHDPSET